MNKVYARLFLLLATFSLATCNCPQENIHAISDCSFHIQCTGIITRVSLPNKCRGSPNFPVIVDITLSKANEKFDERFIDTEFLSSITTLRASAKWPQTNLSFLEYMPKLQKLFLTDDDIERIEGEPFYHLSRLESIDLSNNHLTDIEEIFQFESQPNRLRILSLAHNAIDSITGATFEALTSLIELDISHNLISDLNEEPFFNLTSLRSLRLNNNRITDLNGAVNNLVNLKHLYLRGNQIQNIDETSLKVIYHLETFDVSGNQLDKLTPILFSRHWQHFGGVCKIILSENQITSIPNGTSKELFLRYTRDLKKHKVVLTKVDLSKNAIERIEYNAFSTIVQLISLDLSCNKLTDFIVNPDDMAYVTNLNLSSNYIAKLYYKSFSSMNYLQNLDLSHNSLDDIPDNTFRNNYNLKNVNMTHNGIKKINEFHIEMFHPQGGELDLSNNGLSSLYIPRDEGKRLNILRLRSNDISDATFINLIYHDELKTLEMKGNRIRKLNATSLRLPYALKYLDLSDNEIDEIGPSTFHRVNHLSFLNLCHNRLESIEYGAFQGLISLTHLDLSYNQIKYLDSKVLMDLKSLNELSLSSNGLRRIDYDGWFNHKYDLRVYLEGNSFRCDWLAKALHDFHSGYSKMIPTVHHRLATTKNSLEEIPCVQEEKKIAELIDPRPRYILADERLLVTNQKILEAVKEQTYYLQAFMNRFKVDSSKYKHMINFL